jgi:hypothetical protein
MHLLVVRRKLRAISSIPDQEFAIDEVMPAHLVLPEEPVEFGRVGRSIRRAMCRTRLSGLFLTRIPGDGPPPAPGGVQITQRQFRASYLSLRDYIAVAYKMPLHQVSTPDWAASQRFEIVATFPDGATSEQFPRMLQTLLVNRFGLQTHRQSREMPVYALEVAAGGLKLAVVPEDAATDAPFTVASSRRTTSRC